MTQDEMIEMARQAQMPFYWRTGEITYLDKLEAFAKLVAQHEREACAKVCDEFLPLGNKCAYAIRARDKQDGECKYCTDGCPACDARKLPQQKPYAFEASMYSNDRMKVDPVTGNVNIGTPQRTWVEIDDEDFSKALELCDFDKIAAFEFFEAKLKEKNT